MLVEDKYIVTEKIVFPQALNTNFYNNAAKNIIIRNKVGLKVNKPVNN